MVTAMDENVGKLLRSLEDNGLAGNTIVMFTSDNGGERFSDTWPFSGKKMELLEGGIRIPQIVRWPGRVPAGSVSQQVTMTMDWMPTLLGAAGTAPDPAYPPDGINLLPQLTQNAAPVSRKIYWRYNGNAQRAMRDGDLKWLKIRENTFLFNVVEDPLERANLKNRLPEAYNRMVQDYENWNAQMLPQRVVGASGMLAPNVADHYGNEPQRSAGAVQPQPAKPEP
jgi:arylsulfatase A-like enzyme